MTDMTQRQDVEIAVQARHQTQPPTFTEAQILRMDNEYMGQTQQQCFRELLMSQEGALEARARSSAAEIAMVSAEADPVDRASVEEEHQLAIAARARDASQLVEVRAALRRIEAGDFGWCIETGDMIGVGRLLVCPTTTLCVEAQQRRESLTTRYRG